MALNVTLQGDVVVASVQITPNNTVNFSAARVRNHSSGIHANVRITLNDRDLLAGDLLNFEKNVQRVSLSNAAHTMLPDTEDALLKKAYPKLSLKRDLDAFCEAIWEVNNGQFEATMVEGDPDSNTEWFCPPLVMQDASAIMFGSRGSGKSVTAMTAAVSMQHGISNIWDPIEIANGLYINIERGKDSMKRRLARINVALGLSAYEPLLMLNARGKSLDNIYEAARRSIKEHEVQVVFLDSISRTQAGNLNDNEPANQVVDMLSALSSTWLAIAHLTVPDNGKVKVFGSQMFENAADVVVKLSGESQDEKLGVSLEIVKGNDTRQGQRYFIAYEFNGTGLTGIRNSSLREFPDLDDRPPSNREKVKTFISNTPDVHATTTEIADGLNMDPPNVGKILQHPDFVRLEKEGREQPYGLAFERES